MKGLPTNEPIDRSVALAIDRAIGPLIVNYLNNKAGSFIFDRKIKVQ